MKKKIKSGAALVIAVTAMLFTSGAAMGQGRDAGAAVMTDSVLPGKVEMREDYTIVVNGDVVSPDVPPVELNGIIYVPIRFVGDALGAKTQWDAGQQLVTLSWPGSELKMTIGSSDVTQNGESRKIEAAPLIYSGRTMVPLKISAQAGGYTIRETAHSITLVNPGAAASSTAAASEIAPPKQIEGEAKPSADPLKGIRDKAKNDPITKSLKWYVLSLWGFSLALLGVYTIGAFSSSEPDRFKDKIFILAVLGVGVPIVLIFMLSTYWAAMVPIVTCIVGLVSKEEYKEKLVTMANTAQGIGLICTLFGLGLLIGPAIADRNIHAIGYGIYVKIEPTITGLVLSILMNMLYGYERKQRTN